MPKSQEDTKRVHCQNEYDRLKKVIVCSPQYMKIGKVINETQKHYITSNIDAEKAVHQHEHFVDVLKDHEVEIISLSPQEKLNEQVFTRDIGFCIGEQLLVAVMGSEVREQEIGVLKGELHLEDLAFKELTQKSIEGGDVIVDGSIVWVGISDRTTYQAVDALQGMLPSYQVNPLPIAEKILHLDCAFNIVGEKTAIVYPKAFADDKLAKLKEHYDLIEVTDEEQFTLGTNVLSIGNKKIISMPQNKLVNQELTNLGYQIIEVDFSEIIKSGGSFRCCSFPLLREN